ncbi:MAG TPA: hypothetical protein PK177_04770 [Burkholderiaceae bacterium]|nr:hypothetical protein [Burkholderiaceae bacterium]
MRYFVVLAALLVCASAQPKEIYVHGEGARSCHDYLRHRNEGSANQDYFYATWLRGFLAGYSVATSYEPASRRIPSAGGLLAAVDDHCHRHPRDRVADAAVALAGKLGGRHR